MFGRPRIATLALVIATVSLGGCFGGSSSPSPSDTAPGTTDDDPGTTEPSQGSGSAPVASILVSRNGTLIGLENGSFPVSAGEEVELDGSGSYDPDGGDLVFAWDLGDGNTSSNAAFTHEFGIGRFVVTLTVMDADSRRDSESVTINATDGAGPGGMLQVLFEEDGETPKAWTTSSSHGVGDLVATEECKATPEPIYDSVWHTTTAQKHNGTKSWTMQNEEEGGYSDCQVDEMTSPSIDARNVSMLRLSFWYKGDSEVDFDFLSWYVSSDGVVWSKVGNNTAAVVAEWTQVDVGLSAYAGGPLFVKLRFDSDLSCSKNSPYQEINGCAAQAYAGWFVDDLVVSGR